MSVPDHGRFDELLSRYLDASLRGVEERELLRLLTDSALASRFHEATQLDTEIAGVLAGSIPDEVMVGLVWSDLALNESKKRVTTGAARQMTTKNTQSAQQKNGRLLLALAAMIVALLVAGLVYSSRDKSIAVVDPSAQATTPGAASDAMPAGRSPAVAITPQEPTVLPAIPNLGARISSVRGEVYFIGSNGRTPISASSPLNDGGTIRTVGADSRATIALTDGTNIDLLGNTTFTADLTPGARHLYLAGGMLRATVAHQPEGTPMIFEMPQARAIVRGTELALVNVREDVFLVVYKGTVSLERNSDQQELMVKAGFYAHVEEDVDATHAFELSHLPQDLREQLSEK